MTPKPFPTRAAPKTRRIHFRGVEFTLVVTDDPEHDGHILARLTVDKPPRGLDSELYALHMRP